MNTQQQEQISEKVMEAIENRHSISNIQQKQANEKLIEAIENCALTEAKFAVAEGADVNAKDKEGNPMSLIAVKIAMFPPKEKDTIKDTMSSLHILDLLAANGANFNETNTKGVSALSYAQTNSSISRQHSEIAEYVNLCVEPQNENSKPSSDKKIDDGKGGKN